MRMPPLHATCGHTSQALTHVLSHLVVSRTMAQNHVYHARNLSHASSEPCWCFFYFDVELQAYACYEWREKTLEQSGAG